MIYLKNLEKDSNLTPKFLYAGFILKAVENRSQCKLWNEPTKFINKFYRGMCALTKPMRDEMGVQLGKSSISGD